MLLALSGYANHWFSVHLTRFSTKVDFSWCGVRFGSLADIAELVTVDRCGPVSGHRQPKHRFISPCPIARGLLI